MVTRRRSGALAACLGVLALCTAAGAPAGPSGGVQAPTPGPQSAPAPATDGGGAAAPEPAPVPEPAPPAAAQAPPPTTTQPPAEQPPLQQEQEDEQEFQIDVPPDRPKRPARRAPMVPALRPVTNLKPAAGRLAQTGADVRLLAALGTFLIGVGLTLLGLTLPRRV